MTSRRALALTCAVLAIGLTMAGCIHIPNPFHHEKKSKYTGKGERISLINYTDTLHVADALRGQDFFLPSPQPVNAWPQPGGPPDQSLEDLDAGHDFAVAWTRNFGRGSSRGYHVTAPPIAADGHIYVMDAAADVSAIDATDGREIWRKNVAVYAHNNREAFGGGLAYDQGKLFVSSGYRFVAALDAGTGQVLWRTPTNSPVHAAPAVSRGKVFAESTDDSLLSFDEASGAPGWSYQGLAESARILAATSPTPSGDAIVAAFASGELVALQTDNGTTLWTAVLSKSNRNSALSEIRDIPGRPVIYKGDVFAVGHSGMMTSIELRTGNEHWELPVTSVSTPWVAGDVVYVSDIEGRIICASRESGQIYWITEMNKGIKKRKQRALWSGPVLASGRLVIVSDKGDAAALDPKTGEVEKRIKIGQDALMNPIAVGPYLYVVTQGADLVAIR